MTKKTITINATLQKKEALTNLPKEIHARIVCKEQYAVAMFSDKRMAKKLAKVESRAGNDVRYDPELNVMVERFKRKTAEEVAGIISKQLKKQGGKLIAS